MATPSHVDLSVLWVPIMPETSKMGPALEQAGKDAKGKFGQAVKGIADPVQQELSRAGTRIGPTMEKAGHESKNRFAQGVKGLGDHIHNDLVKAGDKTRDIFTGLGRHITSTLTKAGYDSGQSLSQHFADASQKLGGVSGAINKVGDSAKNVGVDLGTWISPLQEVSTKSGEITGKIGEFADTIKHLPGHIGKVGTAIEGLMGPLGAAAAAVEALDKFSKSDFVKNNPAMRWAFGSPPDNAQDNDYHLGPIPIKPGSILSNLPGLTPPKNQAPVPGGPPDPNGAWRNLILPGSSSAPAGAPPMPIPGMDRVGVPPGYTRDPWRSPANPGSAGSAGGGGGGSNYAASGAGSASSGTDWDAIAQGESGGNWSINTGNGYFGGLQIAQSTWDEFGGKEFAERPDLASREQQIEVAERILRKQGRRAWPNTYQLGAPDRGGSGGGGGRSSGPSAPSSTLAGRGARGLPNVRGAHPQLAYALRAAQSMFPGLTLTAGRDDHPMDQGWHPRGQAIDIGGGTPEEQAELSNWLLQFAPYIEEMIHSGPGVTQNIKSGRIGPAIDMAGSVYNSGQAGYHGDHVHLAITDQMAQAFEDAIGAGGGGSGGSRPIGTQHDPIYVSSADKEAGGSGSPFEQQGQQLAQGMSKGFLELFGIDGSVFKGFGSGKSPLDFGIMKLGGGLLNWIGGLGASHAGAGGAAGAVGGDGAILPGLGALIPNVGAAISASAIPQKAADAAGGGTTINNTYHGPVGPQLNVTQQGVTSPTSDLHEVTNGASNRLAPMTANLPTAGG